MRRAVLGQQELDDGRHAALGGDQRLVLGVLLGEGRDRRRGPLLALDRVARVHHRHERRHRVLARHHLLSLRVALADVGQRERRHIGGAQGGVLQPLGERRDGAGRGDAELRLPLDAVRGVRELRERERGVLLRAGAAVAQQRDERRDAARVDHVLLVPRPRLAVDAGGDAGSDAREDGRSVLERLRAEVAREHHRDHRLGAVRARD